MYKLTDNLRQLFLSYQRQIVSIKVDGVDGEFELTESDILQNTLSVDRYSVSGERIEIGSAIASELSFTLNNDDGKFDDVKFEGAELYVRLGIKKWNAKRWEDAKVEYVPIGYFTVEQPPRKHTTIELTALDRMRWFDQLVNVDDFPDNLSVKRYIDICCSKCGVPLYTNVDNLPNADYVIETLPDADDLTYRKLLQWCCEITGTCAFIDWDGQLRLAWYSESSERITTSERYDSDLWENDIQITGVAISDGDNYYISGTDDYTLEISDNSLITHDQDSVLANIAPHIVGFKYRPFSAETKPLPHVYPLDGITFVDKNGGEHYSIVTNITFSMNAHTQLSGSCETSTTNDYYTPQLTSKQAAVIRNLQLNDDTLTAQVSDIVDKETNLERLISERTTAAIQLNDIISNAMGLYETSVELEDGSVQYYLHDKSKIAESSVIYTINAGGFAWTENWNNGNPEWTYGIDKYGNAILRYLSVNKLSADFIDVKSLITSGEFVAEAYDSSGNVNTRLSITSAGIAINSENFKLTTDGVMTATGGTIAGFTIDETKLTNSDGKSKIVVVNGNNTLNIAGSGITYGYSQNNLFNGWSLTSSGLSIASNNNGYSGIKLQPNYTAINYNGTYNSTYGYVSNSVVAEGCLTASTQNGAFIVGNFNKRLPGGVYDYVYEWGAYARFADYQTAELVYDSRISGTWKLKDINPDSAGSWLVSAPHISYTTECSINYVKGSNYNKFNTDGTTYSDGTLTGTLNVMLCGNLKIIFITYIGSTGDIAQDGWYTISLKNYISLTTAYSVLVTSATSSKTDLSNNNRSNEFVTILNKNTLTIGMDNNTASGFRAVVFAE